MIRTSHVDTTRGRGDGGSVIVETALVLPMLFTLVMALFEFGFMELKSSQLTNAARDGARVAIIKYNKASQGSYSGGACPAIGTGSPAASANFNAICTAVTQRLAGTRVNSITVQCFSGTSSTTKTCSTSAISPGVDTISVTVSLTHMPLTYIGKTFIGTSKAYSSTSRMLIP